MLLFCCGRQIMNEGWRPIEIQIETVLSEQAPTGCFYLYFCMAWGCQSLNFNYSVPLTVTAKIHPKSPLAMDFSTPESLSYGQRKALACAAKCADLLNSYNESTYIIHAKPQNTIAFPTLPQFLRFHFRQPFYAWNVPGNICYHNCCSEK